MQSGFAQELHGKTALVTGGTRGIGFAIARAFLERGARVAITGRKEDGVRAAVASLRDAGPDRVLGVAAHSARPEDVARAFGEAQAAFGTVQVVVNNAATNPTMVPLAEVEPEVFDKILETNLKGYWLVAREAARRLREAGVPGSIVNVSSVAAFRAWPGLGAYGVSKAAVNMLTQVLAAELGRHSIRVNGIAPGVVRTRFSEALWKAPGAEEKAAARSSLGRIGEPEDIAGAAVFLASDASRHVTGQTIIVDGGTTTG
ncbi:MAG: SDR family oxidoreductase [Planctomycetes bacterium]|nr:SDR family oxidoreductase [Planctomycetota bacterium]